MRGRRQNVISGHGTAGRIDPRLNNGIVLTEQHKKEK